jgi:transcriptional regulator
MYTPTYFKTGDDQAIKDFIRQNGFGILVSAANGKPLATHIPLELSEDGTKLYAHISKGNPQGKDLQQVNEVLVIFNGPHAYISSSWYNHLNVPTWNYIAVHVYGIVRIVEGEELFTSLAQLMNKYEQHSADPVTVENLTPAYIQQAMKGVTGFEITITKIEATHKLSQNRDHESYTNIIHELDNRSDADSTAIADAMRKNQSTLFKDQL